MIVKVPWHKFCRTKKLFSLGLRLVNKTRSRLDDSNETWTKVSLLLSRIQIEKCWLTISQSISPILPTGNPALARSFIFWLYWLCCAKTSSKLGKSWSTNSRDMKLFSIRGRKNNRSRTFKVRTWLFSVWKNSAKKRRRNSIQYNIKKEMETEMDKRRHEETFA